MVMSCPGYSKEFDPSTVFRKILVPIDFSPESRSALITACEMRRHYGSEIHVFLMRGFGENDEFLAGLGQPRRRGDVEESARAQLDMFGRSICSGTPCLVKDVLFGDDVVGGITRAVQDCDATIVILAVHKERSFFRTRAEKVIRELKVPVLLMRAVETPAVQPRPEEALASQDPSAN
jgi:nucleotide-binding universal stress UspA family protein